MNAKNISVSYTFTDTVFKQLENELPPVFARKAVGELLGQAVCAGTLANLGDQGPPFIRIGRHAVYERASFLTWLRKRSDNHTDNSGCSN